MQIPTGVIAFLCAAVVSTAAYSGFLAWDTGNYYGPDGTLHGPFHAWQVVGVAVVIAAMAFVAGYLRHTYSVIAASAIALMVGFSISGATSPRNDGLWPIGTFLVGVATVGGMLLAAAVGTVIADRTHRRGIGSAPPTTSPPHPVQPEIFGR